MILDRIYGGSKPLEKASLVRNRTVENKKVSVGFIQSLFQGNHLNHGIIFAR